MKKTVKYLTLGTIAALGCISVTASAEEEVSCTLEPNTVYEIDLQGDGTMEQLSYKTYTDEEKENESRAVLEIYINGKLSWSVTDETWSYYWDVDQCPMEDGSVYLLANSRSDNDWTNQTLLLAPAEDSYEVLADLSLLSRETEEEPDNLLSGWARCQGVASTEGNTITVNWLEMLIATGNITIPVTYEIGEDGVKQVDGSCRFDEPLEWTAWQTFNVFEEADIDSDKAAYVVEADDKVQLTEVMKTDGSWYIKCINADGEEGWFPDPEEYSSGLSGDGSEYLCGYFREAVYAG